MRNCGGFCAFCGNPCTRGEISGNQEKISPIFSVSPEEEQGASEAFDKQTELAVVESAGTFELVKSPFRKERVRRVK